MLLFNATYIKLPRSNKGDNNVRDIVLVDVINYLGRTVGFDLSLMSNDLYDNKVFDEYVAPRALLTVVQNYYSCYIYETNFEKLFGNELDKEDNIYICDGSFVYNLLDFVNYLFEIYGYDRRFTIKDFVEKYEYQDHKSEMKQLRNFLELTDEYGIELLEGRTVQEIMETKVSKIQESIRKNHEYALAYAYEKLKDNLTISLDSVIIEEKILDMKK